MSGTDITCPSFREACMKNPNSDNCKKKECFTKT